MLLGHAPCIGSGRSTPRLHHKRRHAIAPIDGQIESSVPAETAPRLWSDGRLRLRLLGPGGLGNVAIVDRPFALIGRAPSVDLPVSSPEASLRHVYLHLDRRGVFAIDLVSRSGTRFDGAPAGSRSAWLRPGLGLELAGHRVELLEADPIDSVEPGVSTRPLADPLAEADGLALLELVPERDPDRPIQLLSELSFLGRSRSCVVRAEEHQVARVHGVLVRSAEDAFVVDLVGHGLTINGAPPNPATRLVDGDRLGLGQSRFVVRMQPSSRARLAPTAPAADSVLATTATAMATVIDRVAPAMPPELGEALIAQALQAVRKGQDELKRTNDQLQQGLIAAVRQLYEEQAALFDRHLKRIDRLQHEVAALRDELRDRIGPDAARPDRSTALDPPVPSPLPVSQPSPPTETGRSTSWLLDRVRVLEDQVEQETQSGWRDLLSRLGPSLRTREDA